MRHSSLTCNQSPAHLQVRDHEHWLLGQVQRPRYRQDGRARRRPLQARATTSSSPDMGA